MDVLTWGESMILLTPQSGGFLENVNGFSKSLAGAESNLAIGLSRLGHTVSYLSAVGEDSFGRYIVKTLRGEGVDTSGVKVDDARPTGVFFKEFTGDGRTNTLYYRQHSAASAFLWSEDDFSRLKQAKFFIVSGITPALSETNQKGMFEALAFARAHGVKVVFDPNIRLKLWTLDEARPVLLRIASMSDIVLPGIKEGLQLTGKENAHEIAQALIGLGATAVVVKLGPEGAYYQSESDHGLVSGYSVKLVNEVGAGDAFCAGLVSGLLEALPWKDAVSRACALGALAVTGLGDYENLPYRPDLNAFVQGVRQVTR